MSKIKFSISETLDSVFEEIIKILPTVKTDWEFLEQSKEDKEKGTGESSHFTTEVNGACIKVYERKVVFSLVRGGRVRHTAHQM